MMVMHWVTLSLGMVIGGMALTWLRTIRRAIADARRRMWVCIDLPSPDTPATRLGRLRLLCHAHIARRTPAFAVAALILGVTISTAALLCARGLHVL